MWEIYLDNRIVDTYRGLKAVTVGGEGGGERKRYAIQFLLA